MCPEKRLAKLSVLFLFVVCLFSFNIDGQTKKSAATSKKSVVKKNEKQVKDARKDSRKDNLAVKNSKKDSKNDKKSAREKAFAKLKDAKKDKAANLKDSKKDKAAKLKDAKKETAARLKDAKKDKSAKLKDAKNDKKERLTAKERREKEAKQKKEDVKKLAEARKAEAARRRAEEERRQAVLAEQRRREQLAREARARKIAFERGLRTETIENIENDHTEGEDLQVRNAAVNALGSHAGTVVVMEARTGKIVTIVNQDWAIRNSFKPCSTIKLVTGVAGLNENIINEEGGIGKASSGMKLEGALARSNNGYFQRVGVSMGSGKMIGYAKSLGLGEPTGINAEGENAGKLPYGNSNPRIYSHGDDFEVTPLQLAVMVSALSNGGKKVVPQIPRPRVERTSFKSHIAEQVNLPERSVQGVLPGMIGAAEYGTARRGVDSSMGVAGKTGSCIAKGSWVGLFASIAPVEDPEYSVVVITRGQSERGKYAAAIAGKVYHALRSKIDRNPNTDLARRRLKPAPVMERAAERFDEEGEDEGGEVSADAVERPIIVGRRQTEIEAQPPPRKMVQKTSQSKPALQPVIITFDKSGREKTRQRIVKNK